MTSVRLEQRVVVPPHVTTSDLHGELVVLNLDSETYFGLDAVGARMWAALEEAPTIGAAIDTLAGEYDVDLERLTADVLDLLGRLTDSGLVELANA